MRVHPYFEYLKMQKYIIFQFKLGKAAIGNVLLPNSHFARHFRTPELLADTVAFRGPTADLT